MQPGIDEIIKKRMMHEMLNMIAIPANIEERYAMPKRGSRNARVFEFPFLEKKRKS